ncbi:serine/threonine-protein phosphatase 2A activator [Octopus sinensis]|uniref:Serine/threonine-protein phosphatase 2A activator n=1 Tax=Octopus sinensis TaxID=2607531 RepID=A0A6P7SMM9_9MOLL|nr:serine/threonine-protein phosphatase 2A activator [Octopus sinensis]
MATTGAVEPSVMNPINVETHDFRIPVREILKPDDMDKWRKSKANNDLLGFIIAMNNSVKSMKISGTYPISETVKKLMGLLDTLDQWMMDILPIDQPQRFGNKAFQQLYIKLKENVVEEMEKCFDEKYHKGFPEISTYLVEGIGNSTRIDYGTGHEMSFAAFLCTLYKVGILTEADAPAIVLKVNEKYLQLMRRMQQRYRMEPAGSHGVWSLDDYQFIPFIWGSSQLIGHPRILPKSFINPEIYEHFSQDYIFLACIKYINQVKTGPFFEHSNQLWSISAVASWEKVNSGLIKMYKAEVLDKFPVIQHFLFGSLMSIEPVEV